MPKFGTLVLLGFIAASFVGLVKLETWPEIYTLLPFLILSHSISYYLCFGFSPDLGYINTILTIPEGTRIYVRSLYLYPLLHWGYVLFLALIFSQSIYVLLTLTSLVLYGIGISTFLTFLICSYSRTKFNLWDLSLINGGDKLVQYVATIIPIVVYGLMYYILDFIYDDKSSPVYTLLIISALCIFTIPLQFKYLEKRVDTYRYRSIQE